MVVKTANGKPWNQARRLEYHRERMRVIGPKIRAAKAERGECRDCSQPRVEGRTMCDRCLQKNRERTKKSAADLRKYRKKRGRCRECGEKAVPSCTLCEKCATIHSERSKKRYASIRGSGLCGKCRASPAIQGHRCRQCFEQDRAQRQVMRRELMDAYGGKCACCGESNLGFLTIDHVNGDGKDHRKLVSGASLYPWLKKNGYPQDGFQCLCWNCNVGRSKNGGICPHNDSAFA